MSMKVPEFPESESPLTSWKSYPWIILWYIYANIWGILMVNVTIYGGGSKPITINFSGMNIYLQAILRFTRGTSF